MPIRIHSLTRRVALAGFALAAASVATAQTTPSTPEPESASWRLGVYVGVAHDSPASSFLGTTPGRDHLFIGLEALTQVLRAGPVRFAYAAQLLPVVLIRGRSAPRYYTGSVGPDGLLPGPNVVYAVGLSPFGFESRLPLGHAVEAFGAAATGGLFFARPFPVPEASRINFTLEYGGGLLVRAGAGRWVQLGYKYHHLSNAYTGLVNPGLDAHVLYAGYQWSTRLPR
jgi:hypothetical protein